MFKVTLVGNPNTGKTTLFNTLTRSNEKASNWHGVTVGVKSKEYKYKGERFIVNDTPGVYLLKESIAEEKITAKYLKKHKEDLVVNICDANNIKRNLMLTKELIKSGYQVLVVVNMSNETKLCDYKELSEKLGVEVLEIDARKANSVNGLKDKIYDILSKKKSQKYINNIKIHSNIDNLEIKYNNLNPYKTSDGIDRILLNKYIFLPVFLLCMFLVFYIVFGAVGNGFSLIINLIFNKIIEKMQKIILCININNILSGLIIDGVFRSFLTVFSFLPQVLLLMFFINLLEDTGVMSRGAFMLDGVMKKIGLSGKSLFSIFMGYGCTTSAVVSTRNIENVEYRRRTVMLLPYSTCSAKLPILLTITSLFFKRYQYLFVFATYIFAVIVQIVYAIILNKISKTKRDYMLVEMPKYRFPNFKKILNDTFKVFKDFLIKTGSVIFVFGILIWILQNFDISFNFLHGQNFSKSILYNLANIITPIFKPLGFDNPAIVVALFFGLAAKEMLLVALAMMNGVLGNIELLTMSLTLPTSVCYFTPVSSIVFLVFVILYSPCFSCISSIKSEVGAKSAVLVFFVQFFIAYVVALILKLFLNQPNFVFGLMVTIILAIMLLLMLKSKHKRNCKGNCNACREI